MPEEQEEQLPRQNGLEARNESWINDILNFLNEHGIPVYEGGWNANSTAGMMVKKGPVMTVPERLRLLSKDIRKGKQMERQLASSVEYQKEQVKLEERKLALANDVLEQLWDTFNQTDDVIDVGPSMRILEAFLRQYRPHVFEGEYADARRT